MEYVGRSLSGNEITPYVIHIVTYAFDNMLSAQIPVTEQYMHTLPKSQEIFIAISNVLEKHKPPKVHISGTISNKWYIMHLKHINYYNNTAKVMYRYLNNNYGFSKVPRRISNNDIRLITKLRDKCNIYE
jgi:hypothetical protein